MTENNIDRISNIIRTQDILRRHDFNFKKKFGQNFLTDHNILTKITQTAVLSKEVNVIEIGPGIGSLTQYLLEEAAEVMAFEIDKSLIPILEETMAPYDNFTLVSADILKVDLLSEIQKFKNPRFGEFASIRYQDIDFKNKLLRIDHTLEYHVAKYDD